MIAKRFFDLFFSILGLVLLAPALLLVSILIKIDSKGPVFFRQQRVGLNGKIFRIHKFRTMVTDTESSGLQLTVGKDRRITRIGRWLRRYKLDELPQLIDVLYGEMSIVGPRPEVPRYVALYPAEIKRVVLSVRPGITDLASIEYRNENTILGNAENPERAYIEQIMPVKLGYCRQYVEQRSLLLDLKIILRTLIAVAG
ncbi:MAG TPA: sugar transferase [Gammaproteobacteria bacterium]|nr:sugar transferase [Gammaproteobacteria bacterium]